MSQHNPVGTFTLRRLTFFRKALRVSSEPANWDFVKIKLTSFAKINLCQSASCSLLANSALYFTQVFGKWNQTYFRLVSM